MEDLEIAAIGAGLLALGIVIYQAATQPKLPPGSIFSQIPPIGTPGYSQPPPACG